MKVLLVSEGSGGHLIPAMEVAKTLAGSAYRVKLLYVRRPHLSALMREGLNQLRVMGVDAEAIPMTSSPSPVLRLGWRLGQAVALWWRAHGLLRRFRPQVVVGFGGWVCIPVVLAARQRRLRVLLHEQNVRLGGANRFLVRRHWADQLAISFDRTRAFPNGTPTTVTGLPLRESPGTLTREDAATWCGLSASALTILVMGGSQGSHALNRLVCDLLTRLSAEERAAWQFIHLAGSQEAQEVRQRYDASGVHGWVASHVVEMDYLYQLADVVIARAGAATIAELARSGRPAILVPYPHAAGHQRDNAALVESVGGGVMIEEAHASVPRVLGTLRRMAQDVRLRQMMATQIRLLAHPGATQQLASLIETTASQKSF